MLTLAVTLFGLRLEAQDWAPSHIVGMAYVAAARDARIAIRVSD
jgi:hypothetical protein